MFKKNPKTGNEVQFFRPALGLRCFQKRAYGYEFSTILKPLGFILSRILNESHLLMLLI